MNPTTLEKIAQIISTLGAEGKQAFIAWLTADLLCNVICAIGFIAGVGILLRGIRAIVATANFGGRLLQALGSTEAVPYSADSQQRVIAELLSRYRKGAAAIEELEKLRGEKSGPAPAMAQLPNKRPLF